MSNIVEPTHTIEDADIIWFRYKPEALSEDNISKYRDILEKHKDKIILNHIDSFKSYDSKDRCFKIWKDNKLTTPDCIVVENFEDIQKMLKKNKKICLRSNNESGGIYLNIIDNTMGENYIKEIYNNLIDACKRQIKGIDYRDHLGGNARGPRPDTKIIAVEFLKLPKIKHLHRVYVVADKVVGGYSLASESDNIHWLSQTFENIDEFIKANIRLGELCKDKDFCKEMTLAVSSLNIQIGAVEFFEINGKYYLIEVNPSWGTPSIISHTRIWSDIGGFNYGDPRIRPYMIENREKFKEKAWPLYEHNELVSYYNFYKSFSQFK
jgi:glutathione synthase/RimK-type ligase-like ATP-grasp enzyme